MSGVKIPISHVLTKSTCTLEHGRPVLWVVLQKYSHLSKYNKLTHDMGPMTVPTKIVLLLGSLTFKHETTRDTLPRSYEKITSGKIPGTMESCGKDSLRLG